jgi:hypothetical protein
MENLHTSGFFSESLCGIPGDVLSRKITEAYRRFYIRPGYLAERVLNLKTFDEFMIHSIAGMNVMQFAVSGRK